MSNSNIETVQEIYAAYGRGDVGAIIDRMAADVSWEHHPTGNSAQDRGVIFMRRRRGRDEVAEFFGEFVEAFEMPTFKPHSFLSGDGKVAVVIEYELVVRASGRRIHDEEVHLWDFDSDGRVAGHRGFLDTAKAIEAS